MNPLYFALQPTLRSLAIDTDSLAVREYLELAYERLTLPSPEAGLAIDRGMIKLESPQLCQFNNTEVQIQQAQKRPISRAAAIFAANQLFWRSLALDNRWLSLYGSALTVGGRAFVVAAPSRTGKTTLSLSLLRRGARLHSDEFVCIRYSDLSVSGLRRTLVIRESSLGGAGDPMRRLRKEYPAKGRAGSRVWHFVKPEDIFGEQIFAQPETLRAVILLQRASGTSLSIRPLNKTVGTSRLLQFINGANRTVAQVAALTELFEGVSFFSLDLGDPERSAEELLQTIASC